MPLWIFKGFENVGFGKLALEWWAEEARWSRELRSGQEGLSGCPRGGDPEGSQSQALLRREDLVIDWLQGVGERRRPQGTW